MKNRKPANTKHSHQPDLHQLFHYPDPDPTTYGRAISVAESAGVVWSAVQKRCKGREFVSISRRIGDRLDTFALSSRGHCHQPHLTEAGEGRALVVWNEAVDGGWEVRGVTLRPDADGPSDTFLIHTSPDLVLPPTAACFRGIPVVAWSGIADGQLRLHVARLGHAGLDHDNWEVTVPFPTDNANHFRPALAATDSHLFLAWDSYQDTTYHIELAVLTATAPAKPSDQSDPTDRSEGFIPSSWTRLHAMPPAGERWLSPYVVSTKDDTFFLAWLVLREVTDDRGIIDHAPFAMVAQYANGRLDYLLDENNPEDPRIVADLREGLLARDTYMGYHGLRRNPQLALAENGALWCFWERREEDEANHLAGHLVGRLWDESGWSTPVYLHQGGLSYAISNKLLNNTSTISYFEFSEDLDTVLQFAKVPLQQGDAPRIEPAQSTRWWPIEVRPDPKPTQTVEVDGKTNHIFWADTHIHSRFSPDAEGEIDELIHFGRDLVGLDAMSITDNDYYPHKALSEAEWRTHNEYAKHYTNPGRFVLFPGWEFTYHRRDLTPDFDHRIIFYPHPGEPLLRRIDPASTTDKALFEALSGKTVVTYPHHTTYEIIAPDFDRNVEICSSWRVVLEESDFTLHALRQGQRTGFIGSSDTHRAVPGLGGALTGIFAEALTSEALFDAYHARRLIATQGRFVFADFRVAGAFIGQEAQCDGPPTMTAVVHAPDLIEFVEVIRDGIAIHRLQPNQSTCKFEFTDRNATPGDHFYFLRIKLVGDPSFNTDPASSYDGPFRAQGAYPHNLARAKGPFAWTSPVWVSLA